MGLTPEDFQLLRNFIEKQCGLQVGEEKSYLIESRLSQIMLEAGCEDYRGLYLKASEPASGPLREKIIDAITTHETFWFRDERPWKIFREVVLPEFIEALRSGKKQKIRIWCAACSTGQEPYSLAMLIDQHLTNSGLGSITPSNFEILATDISAGTLMLAKNGRYNQLEMSRGIDNFFKTKYFTQTGSVWTINDFIRSRITYKKFNLQDSLAGLGTFDFILCRNVIIYFSEQFKKDLLHRFAGIMAPKAFFFLGSSESLLGYSNSFDICDHNGAIYYRLK